eukprot:COSAG04_NODE_9380_length_869_cov_0.977922_2_plen_130_part_00
MALAVVARKCNSGVSDLAKLRSIFIRCSAAQSAAAVEGTKTTHIAVGMPPSSAPVGSSRPVSLSIAKTTTLPLASLATSIQSPFGWILGRAEKSRVKPVPKQQPTRSRTQSQQQHIYLLTQTDRERARR